MHTMRALLILSLLLSAAACDGTAAVEPSPLVATWQLSSVAGDAPAQPLTLIFAADGTWMRSTDPASNAQHLSWVFGSWSATDTVLTWAADPSVQPDQLAIQTTYQVTPCGAASCLALAYDRSVWTNDSTPSR